MAHSIQVVHDKVRIFDDGDLLAVVSLIELALESRPTDDTALRDLVSSWQRALEGYGPGTINLRLDTVVSSPELREQLRSLLGEVKDDLDRLGASVPASLLNAHCRVEGV